MNYAIIIIIIIMAYRIVASLSLICKLNFYLNVLEEPDIFICSLFMQLLVHVNIASLLILNCNIAKPKGAT